MYLINFNTQQKFNARRNDSIIPEKDNNIMQEQIYQYVIDLQYRAYIKSFVVGLLYKNGFKKAM